jgi:hypothetical protein
MRVRKYSFLIPILLGVIVLAGLLLFWPTGDANAQCGSQASSCKNCHEVQGKDPVNNDGTGWHQSHAFGDFCYICHAGNNQSMDEAEAHAGMVAPLSDVQAGCQSCHPGDLMERAQVYATALGVDIGSGGDSAPPAGGSSDGSPDASTGGNDPASAETESGTDGLSAPAMVVDQADLVDYNMIYAGKQPVNWGNVILIAMIGLVALGGGGYVYMNERKLRGLPVLPRAQKKAESAVTPDELPEVEGYSSEVVALLPELAKLNPIGLHALQRILENPEEASEMLHSLSRLDPELVRRMRTLDHESRALLLALSGD